MVCYSFRSVDSDTKQFLYQLTSLARVQNCLELAYSESRDVYWVDVKRGLKWNDTRVANIMQLMSKRQECG
jgi:hypothetical protein